MRVVVTGGGSGGHVYPALAVVEALHAGRAGGDADVRYIGGSAGIEARIVPLHGGIEFVGVTARKLSRLASPDTVLVLLSLVRGYRQTAAYLRRFRPSVAVSTGGYVAAATAIAAARQGVPLIMLAPDAIPGRTNLLFARWATRICVMFEESARYYPAGRTVETGLPVRSGIVSKCSRESARTALSLDPNRFTVLATGGSQGARALNEIVRSAAQRLGASAQVLHQVGAQNAPGEAACGYRPVAYLGGDEMALAYRAADLTVCRAGAGSLAEATANGLPMLMVPLPTAYADHQTANASAVARSGAGLLLAQSELTADRLADEIGSLRDEPAHREEMAAASRALGRPEAATAVAEIVRELARL